MTRWEYKHEYGPSYTYEGVRDAATTSWLNELGQRGWELVQIDKFNERVSRYVFKRPKEEELCETSA